MPGFWARPAPRSPKTWHICSFPPCTTATARPHVPERGVNPEIGPDPNQKRTFYEKTFITQNLALIFQFLPAPSSSLHPMNGETKCARFLGSPGPAEPENLAHLLLPSLHHSNGKAKCPGMGEGTPRSAPTPIKNALFTKRIYHSKSGPDFSIFARSLLLPTPNERRDQMCQVFGLARPRGARKPGTFAPSLLAPQQRQGQMCRNGGNPEIGPDPNQKRTFYEKKIITQNLALIFQFLPAPSSSLHPMNEETKCARFLGSPWPAEPENLAHLLLPSLHHSNGKAKCAGIGVNPEIGPDPNQKRTFYE